MREIKFRAWDKVNKEMYEVGYIDFANNKAQLAIIKDQVCYKQFVADLKDIELLQYTGLKDQNGIEIYEGHILKREFEIGHEIIDSASLGVVDYEIKDSGYFIGAVCYRPSEGYVLNSCKKFNDDGELQNKRSGVKVYARYAEVIGSIYENQELLKGSEEE